MNYLIDIDNTITTTLPVMKQFCQNYNDNFVKRDLQMNPRGFNESTLFNWTKEEKQAFCDRHLLEIVSSAPVKEGVSEVLQQLRAEGDYIRIVSARKKPNFQDPYGITEDFLRKKEIPYDELIVGCEDKFTFAREHGIDIAADDEPQNIDTLSTMIPVIVFREKHNDQCRGKNIIKVDSWYELYIATQLLKSGLSFPSEFDFRQFIRKSGLNFSSEFDFKQFISSKKGGLSDVLSDVHIRRSQLDKATIYVKKEIQGTKDTSKELQEER